MAKAKENDGEEHRYVLCAQGEGLSILCLFVLLLSLSIRPSGDPALFSRKLGKTPRAAARRPGSRKRGRACRRGEDRRRRPASGVRRAGDPFVGQQRSLAPRLAPREKSRRSGHAAACGLRTPARGRCTRARASTSRQHLPPREEVRLERRARHDAKGSSTRSQRIARTFSSDRAARGARATRSQFNSLLIVHRFGKRE